MGPLDILVTSRLPDGTPGPRPGSFTSYSRAPEYGSRVLVTDKLGSHPAARRRVTCSVEHRQPKYLNNRAENTHQLTRQHERAMKRFTSPRHAQRFLSTFSGISPHFRPHRLRAEAYRREMTSRFSWNEVTRLTTAA
jgi:putative transposase